MLSRGKAVVAGGNAGSGANEALAMWEKMEPESLKEVPSLIGRLAFGGFHLEYPGKEMNPFGEGAQYRHHVQVKMLSSSCFSNCLTECP